MNIKVPYVREPRDFGWCGAASAAMVLKWYGERISQKRVAKEVPVRKGGVDADKLCGYFLRKGYGVTVKFWLPGMRPFRRGLSGGKDNPKIPKELFVGMSTDKDIRTRIICGRLDKFVSLGGIVSLEPPLLKDIQKELSLLRPIIFEINSNWLRKTGSVQASHFVVVKGLNTFSKRGRNNLPRLIFHDPGDRPNISVSADEFLYACHIGYGFAIFIKPARPDRSGKARP